MAQNPAQLAQIRAGSTPICKRSSTHGRRCPRRPAGPCWRWSRRPAGRRDAYGAADDGSLIPTPAITPVGRQARTSDTTMPVRSVLAEMGENRRRFWRDAKASNAVPRGPQAVRNPNHAPRGLGPWRRNSPVGTVSNLTAVKMGNLRDDRLKPCTAGLDGYSAWLAHCVCTLWWRHDQRAREERNHKRTSAADDTPTTTTSRLHRRRRRQAKREGPGADTGRAT